MPQERRQLATTLAQFYNRPVARVSLELFLSLAAIAFFALFAIRPTLLTMADLIKEIEDKRKLNDQLTNKIASLATAQTEFALIENDLPLLDEALPKTPHFPEALKIIERTASDSNVTILSITANEIPKETDPAAPARNLKRIDVPVTVTLTGDYLEIKQFVETLRKTRRTFVLDTVVFSISEERGRKRLTTSISLSIPYFGTEK